MFVAIFQAEMPESTSIIHKEAAISYFNNFLSDKLQNDGSQNILSSTLKPGIVDKNINTAISSNITETKTT